MTEGSRATRVATVAVAAAVLVAVVVVLVLQGPSQQPGAGPGAPVTTVPPPPSSGATPTRTEPPPPSRTPPPTVPPTCPTPAPVQLTVMSFNIHFGTAHDGRVELDRIAAEIRGWQPDVVLLQEVDKGRPVSGNLDQASVLGTKTGLNHVYGGNSRNTGAGPRGNAILTRFPITSATNTHLPMAGGKELRGLLHAQLDVAGVPVSVYASHFDHRGRKARRVQARTAVQMMAADPLPKLFGGDLNTGPDSRPIAILKGSGLGDSWAVGSGKGATVPADRPGSRIDFILHDGWFTPVQAEVLYSAVSDHRAVWTRMQLQPPPAC